MATERAAAATHHGHAPDDSVAATGPTAARPCRQLQPVLRELFNRFPDSIRLVDRLRLQRDTIKRQPRTTKFRTCQAHFKEWEIDNVMKAMTWFETTAVSTAATAIPSDTSDTSNVARKSLMTTGLMDHLSD